MWAQRSRDTWEGWAGSAAQEISGEEASDDETMPDELDEAMAAGEQLTSMLIDLKSKGRLSATMVCQLAYFAGKAGAKGPVSALGAKPGLQSGQYSRKFDSYTGMGLSSVNFYNLPCALRKRNGSARDWSMLPMRPVHEVLHDELLQDDAVVRETQRAIELDEVPPIYTSHPAVKGASPKETILPFCIYIDAVQFTRRDSIIAVCVSFLYSTRRHVVFVCRKLELCDCGCRGWRTLYPVFVSLAWSCRSLLAGTYPNARHDAQPWQDSDAGRAALAGQSVGCKAVCLFLKGDWAELVHRYGLPQWNDASSPCPYCHCNLESMCELRNYSLMHMPCREKVLEDYLHACENASFTVP